MMRLVILTLCIGASLGKNVAPAPPAPARAPAPAPAPAPATGAAPAAAAPVSCGYIPDDMFSCIQNPKIVKPEASSKCDRSTSECDRTKCLFLRSGWYKDDNIDKPAIAAHFTQYARDNPDWTDATVYIKEVCLKDVLPQGVMVDCPAYDVLHCVITGFVRNVKPSQWTSTPKCDQARLFASSCPVCPSACFAPSIPIGSCNACLNWPNKVNH